MVSYSIKRCEFGGQVHNIKRPIIITGNMMTDKKVENESIASLPKRGKVSNRIFIILVQTGSVQTTHLLALLVDKTPLFAGMLSLESRRRPGFTSKIIA